MLREGFAGVVGAEVLFEGAVVACAQLCDEGDLLRALGDEVDCAADGVGAVEGAAGAVEDFDAGDGVEGDGDVEVQVRGLGVVDAQAVEQEEGLLEGGATDGEVGLNSVGAAGLKVEGGVQAEDVDDAVVEQRLVARVEDFYGAIAL